MTKVMHSFRLSETVIKKINILCNELGDDKTGVIENAICYYYKQYIWQRKEGSILPFSHVNLNKLLTYQQNFENEKGYK